MKEHRHKDSADVSSHVELQLLNMYYFIVSFMYKDEFYDTCDYSKVNKKEINGVVAWNVNAMRSLCIGGKILNGKFELMSLLCLLCAVVTCIILSCTRNAYIHFSDGIPPDRSIESFNLSFIKLLPELPVLSPHIYSFYGKAFDPEDNVNVVNINDLASVIWIGRGSKVILHNGIEVSVNFTLCARMIHIFGEFDDDFCSSTLPGKLTGGFGSSNVATIQYRWMQGDHVLAGEDRPYLTLNDQNTAESRYICLRLNLTKLKNEAMDIVSILDVKIPEPPSAKNKASLLQFVSGEYMKIIVPGVEGKPEPEYQWYKNGFPLENANGRTYVVDHVNKSHAGTYSCYLSNIAGEYIYTESTVIIYD